MSQGMTTGKALASLERARVCKEEGNALFQAGDHQGALRKYHFGHLETKSLTVHFDPAATFGAVVIDPKLKDSIIALHSQLLGNLAAVHLARANWPKVIEYCTALLALEPANAKALKRRMRAHLELNQLNFAEADAERIRAACVMDEEIAGLCTRLAAANRSYEDKYRADMRGFLLRK
eukprot:m.167416 g.167416  ORF g.167416 m.167416 type:complete len:178 (-) comp9901_c0_seq1:152-685(-)